MGLYIKTKITFKGVWTKMQNVMKRMKAKKANKGFTMVELIIVIAIIAVLAAVLAPQYLRFVEESRVSTDMSTGTSIETAVNVLIADGTIDLPTPGTGGTSSTATLTWDTTNGDLEYAVTAGTAVTTAATVEDELYKILNVNAVNTATDVPKLKAGSTIAKNASVVWTITLDGGDITVVASPDYQTWAD